MIVEDALRRMYGSTDEHPHGEDVFYYLTVYNEPYQQPADARATSTRRASCAASTATRRPEQTDGPRAQILASGVAVQAALEAQELLAEDWGVAADVWSVTSWNELRRDAVAARRGTPAATRRAGAGRRT